VAAELAQRLCEEPSTRIRTVLLDQHQPIPPPGIDTAASSYRPGTRLREYILTRDRTYRFPGCHRTAARCDIDHITPFTGTNTTHSNLHCLSPRHHHLKHEAGWTITRTPTGTTQWTTPTGHRYDKPPDELPRDKHNVPP
jgi:hypothetical protein